MGGGGGGGGGGGLERAFWRAETEKWMGEGRMEGGGEDWKVWLQDRRLLVMRVGDWDLWSLWFG